jgi:23S rRNA (uracil1939-C5)-methyltransferase
LRNRSEREHGHRPPGGTDTRIEELEILRIGSQGDGIASGPVFTPLTLPGEIARVEVQGERGEVIALLVPSPDRIAPACVHYGDCGGCALQHWADQPYLAWKAEQVRLELEREGLETEIRPTVASPPGVRRRLAVHARRVGKEVVIGFKARRSWRLVEIRECSIADPRLIAALPALRRLAAPFLEHPKSAPTLHVTTTLSGLDIDITGVERRSGGLSADARVRAAEAAAAGDFARVTLAGEIVYQARQPVVRLGPAVVALPPGAFLQASPPAEAAMVALAVEAIAGARTAADLFCGVGTFTFALAATASVLAVDVSDPAIRALKGAMAGAPGLHGIVAEARDLSRRPVAADELKRIEAVVFDPPRAGAAMQAAEIGRSKAHTAVGVSCNPATFARDARILVDAGFRLERVTPVDQFLWSPHIEVVGIFRR